MYIVPSISRLANEARVSKGKISFLGYEWPLRHIVLYIVLRRPSYITSFGARLVLYPTRARAPLIPIQHKYHENNSKYLLIEKRKLSLWISGQMVPNGFPLVMQVSLARGMVFERERRKKGGKSDRI